MSTEHALRDAHNKCCVLICSRVPKAMASCLLPFVVSVGTTGVDPPAYAKFVDYTVETLLPVDNTLAVSTTDLFSGLAAATILSIIFLVLAVIVIFVIVLVALGLMEVITALCVMVFASACLAIYFAIGYTYAKASAAEVAIPLQQDIRTSAILIANSLIRDLLYLSLCA